MKIGRIFDLMTTPCGTDNVYFFVAAPFVEIPTMLYSLFSWDCTDYAWDSATKNWKAPQRRGGRRHGRGGTPRYRGSGEVPREGPTPKGPGYQAYKWGSALQRIGAKLLIIDTALNWDINWMTTALTWSGCPPTPFAYANGRLVSPVFGHSGATRKCDCVADPGNQGISMGIGGFQTTVPVTTLDLIAMFNTVQFLHTKYVAPTGGRWRVFRTVAGNPELLVNQSTGGTPLQGGGHQLWARGRVNFPNPTGMSGYYEYTEGSADEGGGHAPEAYCAITGDLTTSIAASPNSDPCTGLIMGR